MSIDPTQLTTTMAIDKSDDFHNVAITTPTTKSTTSHKASSKQHDITAHSNNQSIATSSNAKTAPFSACKHFSDSVQFSDSSFAQSLLPFIHLLGITDSCIKQLSPSRWGCSWKNLAFNDKDIEDASYLLLDGNTKLLRCGGLLHDKYIATASICDLRKNSKATSTSTASTQFTHKKQKNGMQLDDNTASSSVSKMQWISLPKLNHRRHGHRTLCLELESQQPYILSIGGFDSKGNTINKSEMLSVRDIQACMQQRGSSNAKHSQHSNSKEKRHWSVSDHIMRLPVGVADFGVCHDSITHRVYVCGGLDAQFLSLSNALCFDLQSNKWMKLPSLNCTRHCHRMQMLHSSGNPHVVMAFGGWSGISRNSVEVLDLRTNTEKWQMCVSNGKQAFGALNYPHSNCASIVKRFEEMPLQHKLGKLNMNEASLTSVHEMQDGDGEQCVYDENVVIVCGHREGLFVETNVMEALEMRTLKWETIATFKYAQNHNADENLKNAQQTGIPANNSQNIDLLTLIQCNRYSNAFRYLTFL